MVSMNDHNQKSIGKALQRARKDAGFKSANAFAEHIGMNPGTYRNYEQGDRPFSIETAWDMADALHITLDELVGRKWPQDGEHRAGETAALVGLYGRMDDEYKSMLMKTAASYVDTTEKDGFGNARNVERSVRPMKDGER